MGHPKVTNFTVKDVRFPTSLEQHGSDAMVSNVVISFNNKQFVCKESIVVNSSLSTEKCCNNRKTVNLASPIELKSEIQPFSHSGFSDFINWSALFTMAIVLVENY